MHKENIELKTLNEEAFEKHKHVDLHYNKKYWNQENNETKNW